MFGYAINPTAVTKIDHNAYVVEASDAGLRPGQLWPDLASVGAMVFQKKEEVIVEGHVALVNYTMVANADRILTILND